MGEVGEEGEDEEHVRPHERALEPARAAELRERVRDRRPPGRPLVQAERDPRGVPDNERDDDPRDQAEDQVGLAAVAALEARGPLHLADPDRRDDAHEHEHREDVHQERKPALVPEPEQRRAAGDHGDHRHHDRGEEDEEAPEDERVHEAGDEPLQELPLAEHEHRPVAGTPRQVVETFDRLPHPDEPGEQQRPAREEPAANRERGREGERAYAPRALLSSAKIAGTISWRSPITA